MRRLTIVMVVGALLLVLTAAIAVARDYRCTDNYCPGTNESDHITGDEDGQRFETFQGNDRVEARGGNDDIEAGQDNDELYGEEGDDTIQGGCGNDDIFGGPGGDRLLDHDAFQPCGGDTDIVRAGGGRDRINVDDGDGLDEVYCGRGFDTVRADPGDFVDSDCEEEV